MSKIRWPPKLIIKFLRKSNYKILWHIKRPPSQRTNAEIAVILIQGMDQHSFGVLQERKYFIYVASVDPT